MILFNWEKVYKQSHGKATTILQIIEFITNRPVPASMKDPMYSYVGKDWGGSSFLLKPEPILTQLVYTPKERAFYIGLAAKRNYGEYLMFGKLTLDLALCPVSIVTIENNRLLSIKDDQVHFKFERRNPLK